MDRNDKSNFKHARLFVSSLHFTLLHLRKFYREYDRSICFRLVSADNDISWDPSTAHQCNTV